jgi:MarR family transcriptional regulator, organic hydroperoxide resistance regulator
MASQPRTRAATAERVDEIVDLLFEVVRQLRSHFEASAVDCGLPPAQAAALQQMDRPISMRDLAARLDCDPSNVTGITDRLEARRLVERRPDAADRRVKQLVLTQAGSELRDRLQARLMRGPAPLVGLSDADQEALRDLLRRALDREPA